MVFAMTLSQVAGAVPLARLSERFNSVRFLRLLIAFRTLALTALTLAAFVEAPFASLVIAAALSGLTNGAAYGIQRSLLNSLVAPARLPRALGVAATLNEITFATSPVIASLLGAVSPVFAMAALTVLGIGPLVLMPEIPSSPRQEHPTRADRPRLSPSVYIWLVCAGAGSAVVAAIEVGAVPLAIRFGLPPEWGFVFALTLCIGSVAGGVWVSVRNRILARTQVIAALSLTALAAGVVAASPNMALTLIASLAIGICLPALGTYYSLVLDELAPASRRAEVFALMRTSNALGIIAVSGALALFGLQAAMILSVMVMLGATVLVAVRFSRR